MRVLVTGSRDWQDEARVWDELGLVLLDVGRVDMPHRVFTLVHGDCSSGADRFARRWAGNGTIRAMARMYRVDFYEERHPADWRRFGRRAGMVGLGADLCLAFVRACSKANCYPEPHGSHGASHTVDLARAAGIETRVFEEGW